MKKSIILVKILIFPLVLVESLIKFADPTEDLSVSLETNDELFFHSILDETSSSDEEPEEVPDILKEIIRDLGELGIQTDENVEPQEGHDGSSTMRQETLVDLAMAEESDCVICERVMPICKCSRPEDCIFLPQTCFNCAQYICKSCMAMSLNRYEVDGGVKVFYVDEENIWIKSDGLISQEIKSFEKALEDKCGNCVREKRSVVPLVEEAGESRRFSGRLDRSRKDSSKDGKKGRVPKDRKIKVYPKQTFFDEDDSDSHGHQQGSPMYYEELIDGDAPLPADVESGWARSRLEGSGSDCIGCPRIMPICECPRKEDCIFVPQTCYECAKYVCDAGQVRKAGKKGRK